MIDWAAARLDYVTHHELTYADIAAKYHAAPGSVWNHAARERWTEQRKTAGEQLLEKVRQKAVYSQSEQLAACNARHLELAEKLEQAVKQRLERADTFSENGLACPRWWSRLRASPVWLLGAATENIHSDPYATIKSWPRNLSGWASSRPTLIISGNSISLNKTLSRDFSECF